ncbi:tRNA pseudouridine(38-40) synthase TruA [Bacteroidota bacterium]
MSIIILKIEYDGTNYGGWQIQPNSVTIQEKIQDAILELTGFQINLVGAGRTDAGVHAQGMIAHAEVKSDLKIPENKIPKALNSLLPDDIRIRKAKITRTPFHARFDAIAREYSYTIHLKESPFLGRFSTLIKYDLDFRLLFESAKIFIGKHDFTTFSKLNPDTKNYHCDIEKSYWEKLEDSWQYHVKADRFVYGMVRSLVGAMIDAARGKRSIEELASAFDESDRNKISPLAPPQGLILEKIYYPKNIDLL